MLQNKHYTHNTLACKKRDTKPKMAVQNVKGLPHLCPCNQPTKHED